MWIEESDATADEAEIGLEEAPGGDAGIANCAGGLTLNTCFLSNKARVDSWSGLIGHFSSRNSTYIVPSSIMSTIDNRGASIIYAATVETPCNS